VANARKDIIMIQIIVIYVARQFMAASNAKIKINATNAIKIISGN
jgi:hypothetical protein